MSIGSRNFLTICSPSRVRLFDETDLPIPDFFPDSPIEIVVGTALLYNMLGISCFIGLAVLCLFLPLNHFAGKVVINAQDNLMKARGERVSLMNEVITLSTSVYLT